MSLRLFFFRLHDFGGEGLLPHVGCGGGGGGGGQVALLMVGRLLEHLGGEAEDAHLVPLSDGGGPAWVRKLLTILKIILNLLPPPILSR